MATSSSQFVGNYRLFHLIRAGSVFEVWAVRPTSENVLYAMKWLPPNRSSKEHLADLKHEFAVGKSFDHPGIVKIYNYEDTSNGAYVLMEYFKVQNLKQQIIEDHKGLWHRLQSILVQATAGLYHMHEKGWIHRDIKPDNYLLGEKDQIKLIDFNLARKKPSGIGKLFGGKAPVQGTHSYMAPEQIRGKAVDERADIYSFGCLAYEMLNGKAPFTANSPNELLNKHLRSRPQPLTVVDSNITKELSNLIINHLMAKNAKDRPSSMKDVMMEFKGTKFFHVRPKPPVTPAPETEKPS